MLLGCLLLLLRRPAGPGSAAAAAMLRQRRGALRIAAGQAALAASYAGPVPPGLLACSCCALLPDVWRWGLPISLSVGCVTATDMAEATQAPVAQPSSPFRARLLQSSQQQQQQRSAGRGGSSLAPASIDEVRAAFDERWDCVDREMCSEHEQRVQELRAQLSAAAGTDNAGAAGAWVRAVEQRVGTSAAGDAGGRADEAVGADSALRSEQSAVVTPADDDHLEAQSAAMSRSPHRLSRSQAAVRRARLPSQRRSASSGS
jgi:hypothetical protein